MGVLNLIINGLPSIYTYCIICEREDEPSFKPYYKWITFNINGFELIMGQDRNKF